MMSTDFRCWWQNHYVGDFSLCWWFPQCIELITSILIRSPTSQTCRQHIWSPTSYTNIDVTWFEVGLEFLLRWKSWTELMNPSSKSYESVLGSSLWVWTKSRLKTCLNAWIMQHDQFRDQTLIPRPDFRRLADSVCLQRTTDALVKPAVVPVPGVDHLDFDWKSNIW